MRTETQSHDNVVIPNYRIPSDFVPYQLWQSDQRRPERGNVTSPCL
jgi:hypothetical protein